MYSLVVSSTELMAEGTVAKSSILSVLQDIVVLMGELLDEKNYYELSQKFYSLIEDYSEIQKVSTVM